MLYSSFNSKSFPIEPIEPDKLLLTKYLCLFIIEKNSNI